MGSFFLLLELKLECWGDNLFPRLIPSPAPLAPNIFPAQYQPDGSLEGNLTDKQELISLYCHWQLSQVRGARGLWESAWHFATMAESCMQGCGQGGSWEKQAVLFQGCWPWRKTSLGESFLVSAKPRQPCFFRIALWAWPWGLQVRQLWPRKIKMHVSLWSHFSQLSSFPKSFPLPSLRSWNRSAPDVFPGPSFLSFLAFSHWSNGSALVDGHITCQGQDDFLQFLKIRPPDSSLPLWWGSEKPLDLLWGKTWFNQLNLLWSVRSQITLSVKP